MARSLSAGMRRGAPGTSANETSSARTAAGIKLCPRPYRPKASSIGRCGMVPTRSGRRRRSWRPSLSAASASPTPARPQSQSTKTSLASTHGVRRASANAAQCTTPWTPLPAPSGARLSVHRAPWRPRYHCRRAPRSHPNHVSPRVLRYTKPYWYVGQSEDVGKAQGWLCCKDDAPCPEQVKSVWRVSDGQQVGDPCLRRLAARDLPYHHLHCRLLRCPLNLYAPTVSPPNTLRHSHRWSMQRT